MNFGLTITETREQTKAFRLANYLNQYGVPCAVKFAIDGNMTVRIKSTDTHKALVAVNHFIAETGLIV